MNGDFNPGFGGPIRRDALWFYTAIRYLRADNYVGGVFVDKTEDDPSVWAYTPDTRKAVSSGVWKDAQARLTWQATQVHKLGFSERATDLVQVSVAHLGYAGGRSGPKTGGGRPQRLVTADWTAPLTNRLLFDASMLQQINKWGFFPRSTASPLLIGFLPQSTGMNVKTRTGDYRDAKNTTLRYRFSPPRM